MVINLPSKQSRMLAFGVVISFGIVGCDESQMPEFLKQKPKTGEASTDAAALSGQVASGKMVEKDVEAPEVFGKTDKGLWDGRPSLGGVWVAHPDSDKPERVIIRNTSNGKFVIGALFRRDRNNPGPAFQLSSDAANEIGALAGSPVELSVTALRTVEVPVDGPSDPPSNASAPVGGTPAAEPEQVETSELSPVGTVATPSATPAPAAAPSGVTTQIKPLPRPANVNTAAVSAPKPSAPKPTAPAVSNSARFVQMGFFSVEANAQATLAKLNSQGIAGKIVSSSAKGKQFWRVLAGPAETSTSQNQLLSKVKGMGFADAYLVKG